MARSREAAKSFLSRLRVGFLDADAVGQTSDGRSRVDIVFLHDVIARSAKLAWRRVEGQRETFASLDRLDGEASSRKRPFETGARKTEVFLSRTSAPRRYRATSISSTTSTRTSRTSRRSTSRRSGRSCSTTPASVG